MTKLQMTIAFMIFALVAGISSDLGFTGASLAFSCMALCSLCSALMKYLNGE